MGRQDATCIAAAETALPAWKARTAKERARVLRRLGDLMLEHEEDLARLMVLEQGKPLAEARVEVAYAASFYEWFGEEAKRVYGDTVPTPWPDKRIHVTKEPVGVTAGITPWNFPAAMTQVRTRACRGLHDGAQAGRADAALGASDRRASGGGGCAGRSLLSRDRRCRGRTRDRRRDDLEPFGAQARVHRVDRGREDPHGAVRARAQEDPARWRAPFIVFDDADLDEAVGGAITCKFRNSGQTCISANRLLVHEGVYDDFLARFTEAVRGLKVADGFAEGVNVGPLIDVPAVEKVERHVADAAARGAEVVVGGERIEGQFFQPSVLVGVPADAAMSREETFGPVAGIARFSTEDEAIRVANDTPFGLSAYFYSQGLGRVTRVAEALEYGIVGINTGLISTEVAPFGGVKESGMGREGSSYGIDEWLELKYWAIGGIGGA
jgi:succinate-semialdehyde dehydrogenase/glutarate-semialdehyde dehydrogenase